MFIKISALSYLQSGIFITLLLFVAKMKKVFGISFSQPIELFIILIQMACYINQYYVVIFMLGPIPFWAILLLTFANSRAFIALYSSNSNHKVVLPKSQHAQYCRRCNQWIQNRDHHCIFTGRCVEKENYRYFISYVLYSYFLSTVLVSTILVNYILLLNIAELQLKHSIPLVCGLISGLYFMIFTIGLLSGSFRSIFIGIYTVQEIKKLKEPQMTNNQIRKLWFSSQGRSHLGKEFKQNWKKMVGEDISFWNILFVH